MKVKVVFHWTNFADLEFELEGNDWPTILQLLKDFSDEFDKADREVYPEAFKGRLSRLFGG